MNMADIEKMMQDARRDAEVERLKEDLLSQSEQVQEIMRKLKERMKKTTQEEVVAGLIEQDPKLQEIEIPSPIETHESLETKIASYFDSLWSFLQKVRMDALTDLDSGFITEQQFEVRIAGTAKVWEERLKDGIKKFGAERVSKILSENENIS